MSNVRPAAVAGAFYPADPARLRAQLAALLDRAAAPPPGAVDKMLVVPHAGYVYSGPIAAQAYARLAAASAGVRRIVLAGPTHRVAVRGIAVPTATAFETPLGAVPIDQAALEALAELPQVVRSDRVHADEHAIEVQLPFLQTVLDGGFTLVPLAVGDATPEEVAEVLELVWGGDETRVIVSSDLSHYLSSGDAREMDRRTVERLLRMDGGLSCEQACGAHAINGALQVAQRHGLCPRLLDLRNSGDTGGDTRRVVGYAAFAFEPAPDAGDEAGLGEALLARARNGIAGALGLAEGPEPPHPVMRGAGAVFVTLHDAHGQLRGCVGRLDPGPRLDDEVRRTAVSAAFADSRFAPLEADEWSGIDLEVSLLGGAQPLAAAPTLADAARLLRPGQDGVILTYGRHRATFLPQVWAQLPDPQGFLAELLRKAGLPAHFWDEAVQLERYTVRHFAGPAVPASRE